MLGTQLLLGLQYRIAFEDRFAALPPGFAALDALALLLILASSALLLATPALHRIAEDGQASNFMLQRAARHLRWALLPLATTLGFDVSIALAPVATASVAVGAGALFIVGAVITWYVVPLLFATRKLEETMPHEPQSLEARLVQALTELRVILPGAQALFGFQLAAVLTQAFDRLPMVCKLVHLASLGAVAITIMLLIAPASFHRLAAHGNPEERVLRYTARMMMVGLGFLALGMVGDAYVTIRKISDMPALALTVTIAVLIGFATMLYIVPLSARRSRRPA
jgi:hypothetical protein